MFSSLAACLFAVSLHTWLACSTASRLPTVYLDSRLEEEVFIDQWQFIGPFKFDKDKLLAPEAHTLPIGLNRDFLTVFGLSEEEMTEDALLGLAGSEALEPAVIPPDFANFRYRIQGVPKVEFLKIFDTIESAVVYGAIAIESPQDQQLALAAGSDDAMRLWCNNELVIAERNTTLKPVRKYGGFTSVQLRKGRNLLVAKVAQQGGGWGLTVTLLPVALAIEKAKHHGVLNPLSDRLLSQGDLSTIDLDLYGHDFPVELDIVDGHDSVVHSEQFRYQRKATQATTISAPVLPEGLYVARLTFPMDTLEAPIYFGDLFKLRSAFRSRQRALGSITEKHGLNLEAMLFRYEHLLAPEHADLDGDVKSMWQAKIIHLIGEIETTFKALETSQDPFRDRRGRQLRAFVSEIDGQVQHYMIYVPKNAKVPLSFVIRMPHQIADVILRPFLKSVFVAFLRGIIPLERSADKHGFGIVWVYGRGNSFGAAMGTTDVFEVLNDLKKDYDLDPDRLYLTGVSDGARLSLLMAERFPSLFAAVAVVSPIFGRNPDSPRRSPKTIGRSLRNIPLYILHGRYDKSLPLQGIINFTDELRQQGVEVELEVGDDDHGMQNSGDPFAKALGFLAGKKRARFPRKVSFATAQLRYDTAYWLRITGIEDVSRIATIDATRVSPKLVTVETDNVSSFEIILSELGSRPNERLTVKSNGRTSFDAIPQAETIRVDVTGHEAAVAGPWQKNASVSGPVEDAFGSSFLIVGGRGGDEAAAESMMAAVTTLRESWRKERFVDCRYKTDLAVTDDDIAKMNLVLVGHPRTNKILKRVIGRLPVTFRPDAVEVGGREYAGDSITVEMVHPNPLNPAKYIVVIGSNNTQTWGVGDSDPAKRGIFDFRVWKDNGSTPVDAGYFDSYWKKALPAGKERFSGPRRGDRRQVGAAG